MASVLLPQKDLALLSSDEKVNLLAESISVWVSNEDLAQLTKHDEHVAAKTDEVNTIKSRIKTIKDATKKNAAFKVAEKIESARLESQLRVVEPELRALHVERDAAYDSVASKLHRIIKGPQYAEETSILKALISGRDCQHSALRDALHIAVKP